MSEPPTTSPQTTPAHGIDPRELERAVREQHGGRDLVRLKYVASAVVPILLAHIAYFALSAAPGIDARGAQWRALQVRVMSGILVAVVALSALAWPAWRRPDDPIGWRARLPLAFAALFVWSTAVVVAADQLVTTAITPFITAGLGVAISVRLCASDAALVYGVGFAIVEAGIFFVQRDGDGRVSSMLNAFTVSGVVFAITLWKERASLREERARRTILQQSEEIRRLRGYLRLCAWCKRVSNEEAGWETLDTYVARSADVRITHGLCEDCSKQYFEEALADAG